MTLALTLIAFGLMITIHELGHFWMARRFGVGIEKFSIGFGRPILKWERKGVEWRVGWIPLGGYVRMKGEDPEDTEADAALSFQKKPWWQRALIALSGPFANLLLGFLLFIISFMLPLHTEDHQPVVYRAEGRWESVFSPGDSISSVNGKPVRGWIEFLSSMDAKRANKLELYRAGALTRISIAGADADSLLRSVSPVLSTTIGEVYAGMPAWRGGLKPGDVILAVDSVAVTNWYEMRERIVTSRAKNVLLTIRRDNVIQTRRIVLEENIALGEQPMIGISNDQPVKSVQRANLWNSVRYGIPTTISFIGKNYAALYKLILRPEQLARNVGGPVMIATMSHQVGQKGIGYLIIFFGSISLILMIMNLLPIPILDGGHIMFCLFEGITGKPVSLRAQGILQRLGLTLLLMLMAFGFYSDISKLLSRAFSG